MHQRRKKKINKNEKLFNKCLLNIDETPVYPLWKHSLTGFIHQKANKEQQLYLTLELFPTARMPKHIYNHFQLIEVQSKLSN